MEIISNQCLCFRKQYLGFNKHLSKTKQNKNKNKNKKQNNNNNNFDYCFVLSINSREGWPNSTGKIHVVTSALT